MRPAKTKRKEKKGRKAERENAYIKYNFYNGSPVCRPPGLTACQGSACCLQFSSSVFALLHKVKQLQPEEGKNKNKVFSLPLPMPLLGKAKPNIIPAQGKLEALG